MDQLEIIMGFPGGSDDKESACNAVDPGLTPGSGRSTGEGNGYPLQYSCQEKSTDRGAWRATVDKVTRAGHNGVTNTFIAKCISSTENSLFLIQ